MNASAVGVLHGGKIEKGFLERLKESFGELNCHLDIKKDVHIYLILKGYKDKDRRMVVIIDQNFLDIVWSSSYLQSILDDLLTYRYGRSLHLWMPGINESVVRMYSVALSRNTPTNFTRFEYSKLKEGQRHDPLKRLLPMQAPQPPKLHVYNIDGDDSQAEPSQFDISQYTELAVDWIEVKYVR